MANVTKNLGILKRKTALLDGVRKTLGSIGLI